MTRAISQAPIPAGPEGDEVDEVVAAVGERLDERRHPPARVPRLCAAARAARAVHVVDRYLAFADEFLRAAAATACRTGLPIMRPLCLLDPADPRGWTVPDAYGCGPALWVAPVLEEGARSRDVVLPRGEWVQTWDGTRVRGSVEVTVQAPLERVPVQAPLERVPVWVRAGSIVVTYPATHVAEGPGDTPEAERPLRATLWGRPRLGAPPRGSRTGRGSPGATAAGSCRPGAR
jgi:hypothetical protein